MMITRITCVNPKCGVFVCHRDGDHFVFKGKDQTVRIYGIIRFDCRRCGVPNIHSSIPLTMRVP